MVISVWLLPYFYEYYNENRYRRQRDEIGSLYVKAGEFRADAKYDEAIEKYLEIIKADKKYAKAYIDLGQLYSSTGRPTKAIELYKEAVNNGVKSAIIYYQYGKVLSDQGSKDEAIRNFEEAIKIDQKLSIAFRELGNLYSSIKGSEKDKRKISVERAVEDYEKVEDKRKIYVEKAIENYKKALEKKK